MMTELKNILCKTRGNQFTYVFVCKINTTRSNSNNLFNIEWKLFSLDGLFIDVLRVKALIICQ